MQVTILGSGSAYGTPQAGNYWGTSDKNEPKNFRTRCSVLLEGDFGSFLIDAGPDLRFQLNCNDISRVDALLFTHAHADHINGLPDVQRLASNQKHPIEIFCSEETFAGIKQCYFYMFKVGNNERGLENLRWNVFKNGEEIEINGQRFQTCGFKHKHTVSTGIRYGSFAYITDFEEINPQNEKMFDCLGCLLMETNNGFNLAAKGNGHNDFYGAIEINEKYAPDSMVLTHLNVDIDYNRDSAKLPENFQLAYDGMKFSI